jgi:hypothetical protein
MAGERLRVFAAAMLLGANVGGMPNMSTFEVRVPTERQAIVGRKESLLGVMDETSNDPPDPSGGRDRTPSGWGPLKSHRSPIKNPSTY